MAHVPDLLGPVLDRIRAQCELLRLDLRENSSFSEFYLLKLPLEILVTY